LAHQKPRISVRMTPTRSSSGPTSVDDLRNDSPIYGTSRRFKGKRQSCEGLLRVLVCYVFAERKSAKKFYELSL
jgi:hypothetical protein